MSNPFDLMQGVPTTAGPELMNQPNPVWVTQTILPQTQPAPYVINPTPSWVPEPYSHEKEILHLKLESENQLILMMTKLATEMKDEPSRSIVLQRITEAEARKMALILSNP